MDYEAMANEELAARARSGDKDAESVLWENVYRLIKKLTRRYLTHCTAAGIEPEDIPRIFEKGFTGYNGRMNKKSTGIGLYLTKKVIRKLNHNIRIESEPSVGTKVIIEFSDFKLS